MQAIDLDNLRRRYAATLRSLRAERAHRVGMTLRYPDKAEYWRGRVEDIDRVIATVEDLAAVAGGRLGVNIQPDLFGGDE